jgi:hypothetical protein
MARPVVTFSRGWSFVVCREAGFPVGDELSAVELAVQLGSGHLGEYYEVYLFRRRDHAGPVRRWIYAFRKFRIKCA